jgi:hypothetical protein
MPNTRHAQYRREGRSTKARFGIWNGLAELRGVLCCRFKPPDGIEANSSIPGFRPADSEQFYIEQHKAICEMEAGAPLNLLKDYLH